MKVQNEGQKYSSTHSQPMVRTWLVVNATLQPFYFLEKQPVWIVQNAGWATGQV